MNEIKGTLLCHWQHPYERQRKRKEVLLDGRKKDKKDQRLLITNRDVTDLSM